MGFSIIYKAKEYHSLYFKILLIDKSIRMLLLFGINICKMAKKQKKIKIQQDWAEREAKYFDLNF